MSQQGKVRFFGFDWLRMIAAFGIVGCHLALPNMTEGALFLKRYTDLNVGVFAAIAGFFTAYSLQSNPTFVKFLKQRILKLLLPLYLWSAFYICIDIGFDILLKKTLSFQPMSLDYWYFILVCGNAGIQTWFLAALFYAQVLLFYPIKKQFYIPYCWGSMGLLCAALGGITLSCDGGYWTYYFLRLVSFFMLGIVMFREKALLQKIPLFLIYLLIIVGILIIASGFRYGFLGECVLSIPMLLWGLCWSPKSEKMQALGQQLGALSFGVYLVHFLFCRVFYVILQWLGLPSNAMVYFIDLLLVSGASLLFSYIVMRLAKRFPKIGLIMPA